MARKYRNSVDSKIFRVSNVLGDQLKCLENDIRNLVGNFYWSGNITNSVCMVVVLMVVEVV
jgi:hypothetical protein